MPPLSIYAPLCPVVPVCAGYFCFKVELELLKGASSAFMQAFHDKGRVSPLLKRVPVHAVLAEAPVELLDVQNGANECWSITEPDMHHLTD